jgi:hypothetical protein
MSKRAVRILPRKTSRRVRSISARVGGKKSVHKTIALKKATQSRLKRRRSNAARPHQELKVSTPPSATPAETTNATDTPHQPAVAHRMTRSHAAVLAAIVVLVVAALALPRRSAVVTPAADSTADTHDSTAQPTAPVPAAPAPEVEPPPVSVAQPEVTSPVVAESEKKSPRQPAHKSAARATRPSIVAPVVQTRNTETALADIGAAATVAMPTPPMPEAAVDHVTITGCLENAGSGDRFRLTDTEGTSAPKSRSWRTGFLKKHSTAVDLVGARDVAALRQQVGQRIAVTGVQTDRELTVSSVRVISTSCK